MSLSGSEFGKTSPFVTLIKQCKTRFFFDGILCFCFKREEKPPNDNKLSKKVFGQKS